MPLVVLEYLVCLERPEFLSLSVCSLQKLFGHCGPYGLQLLLWLYQQSLALEQKLQHRLARWYKYLLLEQLFQLSRPQRLVHLVRQADLQR